MKLLAMAVGLIVFAPSLAIGAGIGDVALMTGVGSETAIPLIALGMVGFVAATTQGPLTAFIIVIITRRSQVQILPPQPPLKINGLRENVSRCCF